jgi:hypothetical protein
MANKDSTCCVRVDIYPPLYPPSGAPWRPRLSSGRERGRRRDDLRPYGILRRPKKRLVGAEWVVSGTELLAVGYIEIDGVLSPDAQLRATAELNYPDARVMLQIERMSGLGGQRQLSRIDWRPKEGHRNGAQAPKRLRFGFIAGTHVHSFRLNWNADPGRMRGHNLPIAEAPATDPHNFAALVALAASEFKIRNMADLKPPPWEPLLTS